MVLIAVVWICSAGAASIPVTTSSGAVCRVAVPNEIGPRGEGPNPNWLGNGRLFTLMRPTVVVPRRDVAPDGAMSVKFP